MEISGSGQRLARFITSETIADKRTAEVGGKLVKACEPENRVSVDSLQGPYNKLLQQDDILFFTKLGNKMKNHSEEVSSKLNWPVLNGKEIIRSFSETPTLKNWHLSPGVKFRRSEYSPPNMFASSSRVGCVCATSEEVKHFSECKIVKADEIKPVSHLSACYESEQVDDDLDTLLAKLIKVSHVDEAIEILKGCNKAAINQLRNCSNLPVSLYEPINIIVMKNQLMGYIKAKTPGLFRVPATAELRTEIKGGMSKQLISDTLLEDSNSLSTFFKLAVSESQFFNEEIYRVFVNLFVKYPFGDINLRVVNKYLSKQIDLMSSKRRLWFCTVLDIMKYAVQTAPDKSSHHEAMVNKSMLRTSFANGLFHWQEVDYSKFQKTLDRDAKMKEVEEWGEIDPKIIELIFNAYDSEALATT